MSYRLGEKEHAAISALRPERRTEHLVKRVADWEEIWGLKSASGWVTARTEANGDAFPVWPHADYAQACATDEWAGSSAESIPLAHFMSAWMAGLTIDGVSVAVFPTPSSGGVVMEPGVFKALLERELENYY